MEKNHLILIGQYWYYQRRVPADVAALGLPAFIKKSTRKTDKTEACIIARRLNQEAEALWQALLEGKNDESSIQKFNSAVKRARALGISYKTVSELETEDTLDIVQRLEVLESHGLVKHEKTVSSVLGGIDRPSIMLDNALAIYIQLSRDILQKKAPDQLKRWQQPRERAIRNLITIIGNKDITEITRHDALDFKDYLVDRVENEEIVPASANKQISQLNTILNKISESHRLDMDKVFSGTRLNDSEPNKRPPFPPEWVQDVILKEGALDGLNLEARMIVYIMCWTGIRPSELANIDPKNIVIDAPIPFLRIKHTTERKLKTVHSVREMPLVLGALEAIKHVPEGFPRYKGKTDQLSAAINSYFKDNGLLPPPDPDFELPHSLYSLRHTFQDKLTELDLIDRKQCQLMGHKFKRSRYGRGASLEDKRDVLLQIGFKSPGI